MTGCNSKGNNYWLSRNYHLFSCNCSKYETTNSNQMSGSAIAGIIVVGLAGLIICIGTGLLMSSICKACTKPKRLVEPRSVESREGRFSTYPRSSSFHIKLNSTRPAQLHELQEK